MNVFLMHPAHDFDAVSPLPLHMETVEDDLAVDVVLRAMAGDDRFVHDIARAALLSGMADDLDTITHRQAVLRDAIRNCRAVRALYAAANDAETQRRQHYFSFGVFSRYPESILHGALDMLRAFIAILKQIRQLADAHAAHFESPGFTRLFAMIRQELPDAYFARVDAHLSRLRFADGVLVSAALGEGNRGSDYVLRRARDAAPTLIGRLFGPQPAGLTFRIHERDEAGARSVGELRDRGLNLVANAAAQSAEHIHQFLDTLRTELAFCLGAVNLHERLATLGAPAAWPIAKPAGTGARRFTELYDVGLALTTGSRPVGNTGNLDRARMVVMTGANQGGKSTFLRSVGLAQLMMQAGLFVGAEAFESAACVDLFTHFRREEDATMTSGKLDEELARMSAIVDTIRPGALVLCNESFASTNEREGSEIARQVAGALLACGVDLMFVTHLYDFARRLFERRLPHAAFLRPERRDDGTRTFRLIEGEPLTTGYAEDAYGEVFGYM